MQYTAPIRVAITTLGCKVNRADSEALLVRLGKWAIEVPFESEADLYIINSCTVTANADRQSRQMIYRARRRNPQAKVVLTGCLARVVDKKQALPAVDRIFSLAEHEQLALYAQDLYLEHLQAPDAGNQMITPQISRKPRCRPFLKIQDGCNGSCTYCIVPQARGPSHSLEARDVHIALNDLGAQGYSEVVLTGIHLGQYGLDLSSPMNLVEMLIQLMNIVPRLRLSSLEPLEINHDLVHLFKTSAGICPHVHIPIQSGDSSLLLAMNRPYGIGQVRELLSSLREQSPHLAIGSDFIVGFPGETDAQFKTTLEFVESSPLTYLHVFPFSPRPGTPAAELSHRISDGVIRKRSKILREMGRRKHCEFTISQIGTIRKVLVENRLTDNGLFIGLTDNYLRVIFPGKNEWLGRLVPVFIKEWQNEQLYGAIVQ